MALVSEVSQESRVLLCGEKATTQLVPCVRSRRDDH